MIKINPVKYNKIWGYELWLYSSLKGFETTDATGTKTTTGPLLKIINTKMPLSIQVHPDDKWAQKLEKASNGKSESWYILKSHSDSELVVGIKTFDESIIRNAISNNQFPKLLHIEKPKKGNFYNIPAGLVHSIGANITLFELQQSSDITYRYFDYNRKDTMGYQRQLHIDKALASQKNINHKLKPLSYQPLIYKNAIAIQEFWTKPSLLKQDALIVDFNQQICYKAIKGEMINFHHYVIIHSFK